MKSILRSGGLASTLFLTAMLLPTGCSTASGRGEAPRLLGAPIAPVSLRVADDIVFEIDPAIELLAGVQSRTSWINGRGSGEAPTLNGYASALSARFSAYEGDEAIRRSQAFTNRGFSYDAPPAFALALGERLEPPSEGWSDYLAQRAGSRRALDDFRSALVALAERSEFAAFFEARRPDYERWLARAAQGFEAPRIAAWLKAFYGYEGSPLYHFVLAPAMFPGGGYGFSRRIAENGVERLHVYQVVRADYDDGVEPELPSGPELATLALHEFGHSFVNPAIGERREAMADPRLDSLFAPVRERMDRMAYGNKETFLNELVLRATVIRAQAELGMADEARVRFLLEVERANGFYCIDGVYAALADYAARRAEFPTFDSFAPRIIAALAERSRDLAEAYLAQDRPIAPVEAFREDFEGKVGPEGLPAGWSKEIGAQNGRDGGLSLAAVDTREALSGSASLLLSGGATTSAWHFISKPLAVKSGTLGMRCLAEGRGIVREGSQFANCYVGFILGLKDGTKSFRVQALDADFPKREVSLDIRFDPAKVETIDFAIFLSMSGELRIDDIEVSYR